MSGLTLGKSKQSTEKATSFTQKAPVQTTAPSEPQVEEAQQPQQVVVEVQQKEEPAVEKTIVQQPPAQEQTDRFPWRSDTAMTEEELMFVRTKKSYDIPMELVKRLEFLTRNKKPKTFGRKIKETELITEALNEYTKKELKALGYKVE